MILHLHMREMLEMANGTVVGWLVFIFIFIHAAKSK